MARVGAISKEPGDSRSGASLRSSPGHPAAADFIRSGWTNLVDKFKEFMQGRMPSMEEAAEEGFETRLGVIEYWKQKLEAWSGDGNLQVHHLVEQGGRNAVNFLTRAINSPANTVPIPQRMHQAITSMYQGGPNYNIFMRESNWRGVGTLREWMQEQDWNTQMQCGRAAYDWVVEHGSTAGFDPEALGLIVP